MYSGLLVEFLLDVFNGQAVAVNGLGVFGAKRNRIGPLAVNIVGTGLGDRPGNRPENTFARGARMVVDDCRRFEEETVITLSSAANPRRT